MDVNAMLYVAVWGEKWGGEPALSLLDKDCLAGKFVLIPSEASEKRGFSTPPSVRGG
jgi:hypothetical protein